MGRLSYSGLCTSIPTGKSDLSYGECVCDCAMCENFKDAGSIIQHFDIPAEEVAILLINGFHKKPEDEVKDGDVIALFPPVGGG